MPITKGLTLTPLPPEEAMLFFGAKVNISSVEFYAMVKEVKSMAFTVSRVASMDILEDIHSAVQAAIDDGETLANFMGRLDDVMELKGWTGLSPWHIENVFRTNIGQSYSVGHENEYEKYQDDFPAAEYNSVNDDRSRDEHAQWDGMVFAVDDHFWNDWTPLNGYNCFPPGSMVHVKDGSRKIELVEVGDFVSGGSGGQREISATHKNYFEGNLVEIILENGVITPTPNHPILTFDGWKLARDIKKTDILVRADESISGSPILDIFDGAPLDRFGTIEDFRMWAIQNFRLFEIISVGIIFYKGEVFNLSIDKDKTYIVDGVTVHNCRCDKRFVHKYEIEDRGIKLSSYNAGTGAKPGEGFDYNPAKQQWAPKAEDYPTEMWSEFKKEAMKLI